MRPPIPDTEVWEGATRLEPRTPNTADCPDAHHRHFWRRRRPELTEGVDRRMTYDAAADGSVLISEEALSQLLRFAGFEPEERHLLGGDPHPTPEPQ